MSKHYNLTVTDDNGKSVTTSNTSTEHSDEILRMMHLAGMQDASCGCDESIEENEYQPTPANDKLDLDDYSKKSGESIPKQKKSLDKAPSRGDNPLEYSLDENEIFESLMNEFEEVEEGKLNPGLQAYIDKKKGKKDDKEDKVEEKKAKPDFADIDGDGDKKETMKKAAKDKKEKANESIEEGFEIDEVKAILAKHGVSNIDDMELDGELYQDLFDYYSDEMPYGTQKARDGDPMDWIMSRLDDLGLAESQKNSEEVEDTGLQSELDRLQKLANIQKTSSDEVDEGMSTPNSLEKVEAQIQKLKDMADEAIKNDDPHRAEMIQRSDEMTALLRKKYKLKKDESQVDEVEVDEVVQLAIPVAKAVGGALLKKGIKGAAARAGASAVANKMMSKPSSNAQ